MAAPKHEIVLKQIQNPDASGPLRIPILVLCNTPDETLAANVRANSARDLPWTAAKDAHDGVAIMIGGGPSVVDHVTQIQSLRAAGGTIFAINGASRWARLHVGVVPNYQVVADAKAETALLVDADAGAQLIASQADPATFDAAPSPTLWHLGGEELEQHFPPERRARGGYALIGGGAATGNSAMCLAYALGFRTFHVFGYDSSHRGGESHAYPQPMNDLIPTVDVEWAGRTYTASVAMKAQAEKFQMTAQALKQAGCAIIVYGDGLLQHMFRTPAASLTERDKYRAMWRYDAYRTGSPGEAHMPLFLEIAKPDGLVLDFGCGTGRASLALAAAGLEVLLIDFADNCRDDEALGLPFLEWDLTRPLPPRARYGICCDVMEHIPGDQVAHVLFNLFQSAGRVFFSIGKTPDGCGALIGATLHNTVRDHAWWRTQIEWYGRIVYEEDRPGDSIFYAERNV